MNTTPLSLNIAAEAEKIKHKIKTAASQIADINNDGTINEIDAKEYTKIWLKYTTTIATAYTTMVGIQDPTQINPYIYTLIALLSILATIITAYIINYVRKNTLQKKSLQKTIENIIDQYEIKVNNLKDTIEQQKIQIYTLTEKLHTTQVYKDFQEQIMQKLYTLETKDSDTLKQIIQNLIQIQQQQQQQK